MQYSVAEINSFIKDVVDEAKGSAKVETGFLKRSIRGNYFRGVVTFREIFYGAYNDNSQLVKIAQRIMPSDINWRIIFVDEEGEETNLVTTSRTGRKLSTKTISSSNQTTNKIRALISAIKRNNASEENDTAERDRESDN